MSVKGFFAELHTYNFYSVRERTKKNLLNRKCCLIKVTEFLLPK